MVIVRASAWSIAAACAVAACSGSGDRGGGTPTPAPSVTLRFESSSYSLYARVAGGPPHLFRLDTGSVGLFVPRGAVGPAATVSATDTCSITYVSSGTTLSGHSAVGVVALLGSSAAGDVTPAPETRAMTFCAVDDPSFSGGMMGVGFGRGGAGPAGNVLLQITAPAGDVHAGYTLSANPSPHVTIGLTADARAGFGTVALTPSSNAPGDWTASSLRGCVAVPSKPGFAPECGPLLVDTGIPECILWGAGDRTLGGAVPSGQSAVPNGVALRIAAEGGTSPLDYEFVVGSSGDSPSAVSLRPAAAFSINTGRALLVDFDYLFDATAGEVGFRRAKP